ncbi:hypothetical protein JW992_08095 [candidate division KSB1 bacterium]|nr:hypothetical protein [candidate division KSB1 bacterium]
MLTLRFDVRDLFRALRIALSLQRMWIQLIGLSVGLAGYWILTYAGFGISGYSLTEIWEQYGLLICVFQTGLFLNWISWIFFGLAFLILSVALLLSATAVARAAYMSGKGNHFYTWHEAYAFAFCKAGSVLMTPISLAVLIGLMVFGGFLVGLLGRIPYIGEVGIALFVVFWFAVALLLLLFAAVLLVSFFLVPVIIATTDEDAFEAVFQTFSLVWSQPWRLFFYGAVNLGMAFLGLFLFAWITKKALVLMNGLFALFMGSDFINLANNGQASVQSWLIYAQPIVEQLLGDFASGVFFSRYHTAIAASDLAGTAVGPASFIYALGLLFIGGWVLSYGVSTFNCGNMLAYLIMRRHKDGENLLERRDKEEEQESDDQEAVEESAQDADEMKPETNVSET